MQRGASPIHAQSTPIYLHSTSIYPIPLIPGKISSSFQKKTNRVHARSRQRRRQRMVTTIEQALNNHWTSIAQILFKPCSTHQIYAPFCEMKPIVLKNQTPSFGGLYMFVCRTVIIKKRWCVGGLQQNLCQNALKWERRKKCEISFAREARVFTFHTYTFFKGTCIPSKSYTVRA